MADQKIQEFPVDPDTLPGSAMPFRFEIAWRSVTQPLTAVPSRLPALAKPDPEPSRRAPGRRETPPILRQAPVPRESPSGAETREFETVLQRLMPPPQPVFAPAPPLEREVPVSFPRFSGPSESRRVTSIMGAALCIALGASVVLWIRQARTPEAESAAVATEVGGGGWMAEWASDTSGTAHGRQLSLYRPSVLMSDYRLEFLGSIERKSLGCVFRAVDSNNYYAIKLIAGRLGTPLSVAHFPVIKGVEGIHVQRTLPLTTDTHTRLKVRLDVKGPRFTLWVQNQVVEDWEDDRLKSGGVGFLNEREESGQVESVQISFPTGGSRR